MGNSKSARGPDRKSSAALFGMPSFGVPAAEAAVTAPANSAPEYDFVIRDIEITDLKISYDSAAYAGLPAVQIPRHRRHQAGRRLLDHHRIDC